MERFWRFVGWVLEGVVLEGGIVAFGVVVGNYKQKEEERCKDVLMADAVVVSDADTDVDADAQG